MPSTSFDSHVLVRDACRVGFCCLRPPCSDAPPPPSRSPPRALFLFPENESIGVHSLHALPWTDGSSSARLPVLLIALNLTATHAPVIYVHLNRIPIARFSPHVTRQQLLEEELPLQCWMQHGARGNQHVGLLTVTLI